MLLWLHISGWVVFLATLATACFCEYKSRRKGAIISGAIGFSLYIGILVALLVAGGTTAAINLLLPTMGPALTYLVCGFLLSRAYSFSKAFGHLAFAAGVALILISGIPVILQKPLGNVLMNQMIGWLPYGIVIALAQQARHNHLAKAKAVSR